MKYTDFIKIDEEFQYSINLSYDLYDLKKIRGYIPTNTSISLLNRFLKQVYVNDNDKATVIIGPYGKGKSHLMLVLIAILSNIDKESSILIAKKIKRMNIKVGELCEKIIEDNVKYLPVIINSNSNNLEQAFLIALSDALKVNNLKDVFPETYFDSVLKLIEYWKVNLKELYSNFKKELNKRKVSIRELERGLQNYKKDSYEMFTEIYKVISSGLEYNPFINSDVVKIYDDVNYVLTQKYGYRGIFIVFDEFSKFLEGSTKSNSSKELKLLQDFAELSNRSTNKQQLFLTCITHKSINEYIRIMPNDMINAWRAIEGRFKELYFTNSINQNYELISNAIVKDYKKFLNYLEEKNVNLKYELKDYYSFYESLYSQEDFINIIAEGCFPLNPVSVYILPLISEKIAQNERTLFTYLSKNQKYTLATFINENDGSLKWLNVDSIYDYFEELFRKELFNENIYNIWKKGDAVLRVCKNNYQKGLIKAIVLFNMIDNPEHIPATSYNIKLATDIDDINFKKAVEELINQKLIFKKSSTEILDFTLISDQDVFNKIETIKNSRVRAYNISEVLEDIHNPIYILPKRYNDEFHMVRFFINVYMTHEILNSYEISEDLFKRYKADGLVINLVHFNKNEVKHAINKVNGFCDSRIILNVPKERFSIEESIKEYLALKILKEDKRFLLEHDLSEQIVEIMQEHVADEINSYMYRYFSIEEKNVNIYHKGKLVNIHRNVELNQLISAICTDYYSRTPVINNEMINKENLTKQILLARKKIIDYLLSSTLNINNITLSGKGPEVTIYNATIANKGLDGSREANDENLMEVIDIIKNFISSATNERTNFNELYRRLKGQDYGIRNGIIPIYIAYVLKDFINEVIVSTGEREYKEIQLNSETLDNINLNPSNYYIYIDIISKEKEEYIETLKSIFEEYIDNTLYWKNKYLSICNAIQKYVQGLSQYSRIHLKDINGKELNKSIIKFRSEVVKYDINPREFLFKNLMKISNTMEYDHCANEIIKIKSYLDNSIKQIKDSLINETKEIVNKEYKGTLSQALKSWYSQLDYYKKTSLYNTETNKLLGLIVTMDTNDDYEILNMMAYILTGLNVEDWNDETIKDYKCNLKNCIDSVRLNNEKQVNESNIEMFTVSIPNGNKALQRNFEQRDISEIGITLVNQLEELFDEYGEAIEDNEKRNILMQMLIKYI